MHDYRTLILGASSGLGREIAELCRQQGWKTIEVSLERETSSSSDRYVYQCDVSNAGAVDRLLSDVSRQSVAINRFFWVAGTLWRGQFADQPKKELSRVLDVNIRNSILVAQWAWQQMARCEVPGNYTVVSSASGVRTYENFLEYTRQVSYVTTKYAQVGFTRALAGENTNPHIKFSLILPDGMDTPMRQHFSPEENQNLLDPAVIAAYLMEKILNQTEPYFEEFIAKGSLDTYAIPAPQVARKPRSA